MLVFRRLVQWFVLVLQIGLLSTMCGSTQTGNIGFVRFWKHKNNLYIFLLQMRLSCAVVWLVWAVLLREISNISNISNVHIRKPNWNSNSNSTEESEHFYLDGKICADIISSPGIWGVRSSENWVTVQRRSCGVPNFRPGKFVGFKSAQW